MAWGAFHRDSIDPSTFEGMKSLALCAWNTQKNFRAQDVPELKDDLYPCCPLESLDIEIAGLSFAVEVYQKIMRTLGVGGYKITFPPKNENLEAK